MDSAKKTGMSEKEREELAAKLDKDLDEFIEGLEKRSYSEGWPEDKWQEEMEKHPFFMTKAPNPNEELSPLMEGIQQLKYDASENTPEELAAAHKEDGNFNFKCEKYRFAILSYTEGIKLKCSDDNLNAILYSNRATANFCLKNYRTCLADCLIALKLQPDYEKPLVKAAHCCYHLGRYKDCLTHCDHLLNINPSYSEIIKLKADAVVKQKIADRNERKETILMRKLRLEKENLLKAIQERNIIVLGSGPVQSLKDIEPTFPEAVQRPVHLENGCLVWPVIFLYPEFQTSDFVQEFHENTKFSTQLAEVFAEPPDWDVDKKYTIDNIHVYFEDPEGEAHKINTDNTLRKVLSDKRYRVDGGTPTFIILVKGTKAEERFLEKQ